MPVEPPRGGDSLRWEPRGYLTDGRECPEPAVTARPPQPRREFHGMPPSRPAPGVVQVQVAGASDDDVQRFVEQLRAGGFRVWVASRKLYERRDGTKFRYYTVELKQ